MLGGTRFAEHALVGTPGFSRVKGIQIMIRASAPAKAQESRTFFVTTPTFSRRNILQSDRLAQLFIAVLNDNREKQRLQVHAFVVMPDHVHFVLTPAPDHSLEKCVQFIKGGFSFRAKKELGFNGEIWAAGFNEERIRSASQMHNVTEYIHQNPVKRGLAATPEEFPYSSASVPMDPAPESFRG